jgi:hypothetical protein
MRIAAMMRSFALLITGSVATLAAPAAHATAVWTFYETGCFAEVTGPPCSTVGGNYFTPPLPAAVGHFILPDINSSGTYSFSQPGSVSTFVQTGDTDFLFIWGEGIEAPAGLTNSLLPCGGFFGTCEGTITWSSAPTRLDINVVYDGSANTMFNIGVNGGVIGSDSTIFGCGEFAECGVTGFWSAPEPSSLVSLAPELLIVFLVMYARSLFARHRTIQEDAAARIDAAFRGAINGRREAEQWR